MGVYIKGMELPKDAERVIVIVDTKDGREACTFPKPKEDIVNICEPHGRLIDERVAYDKIAEQETGYYMDMDGVDRGLQDTPTVIEGSE